jgi:hypothetical protein
MYSWRALEPLRAISFYEKAIGRLDYAALGQPTKAYPRYLLSIAHLLAAEIYRHADQQDLPKADEAYVESLAAAREAQLVEPTSPRGYAAEAGYYESRGKQAVEVGNEGWRGAFEHAIAAWNQFDNPAIPIRKSESDWSERFAYQMRLHFWLGQYGQAEAMRRGRYTEERTGYRRQECFDADDCLYEALIAASAGDHNRADDALSIGTKLARHNSEHLLNIEAACRLLGRPSPPGLPAEDVAAASKLSPGWTPKWLATLVRFQRGEADWLAVEQASRADTKRSDDSRLRMAGAYFHRGVRELAAGDRRQALEAFSAARDRYDNENYCFRAELLLNKLQTDPDWPPWVLAEGALSP